MTDDFPNTALRTDGGQPPEDDLPVISCSRCGEEWDLEYELDELQVGNQAVERFALDHHRHLGHFPDDVTPWIAECRRCPDGERFLSEMPALRWCRTHARHTRHPVELTAPEDETPELITPAKD